MVYHIGVGRTCAGTHVITLVQDLDIRFINAATGELLRELTIDPARNYQRTGKPPAPPPGPPRQPEDPEPKVGSGCPRCLATSQSAQQDSNLHTAPEADSLRLPAGL